MLRRHRRPLRRAHPHGQLRFGLLQRRARLRQHRPQPLQLLLLAHAQDSSRPRSSTGPNTPRRAAPAPTRDVAPATTSTSETGWPGKLRTGRRGQHRPHHAPTASDPRRCRRLTACGAPVAAAIANGWNRPVRRRWRGSLGCGAEPLSEASRRRTFRCRCGAQPESYGSRESFRRRLTSSTVNSLLPAAIRRMRTDAGAGRAGRCVIGRRWRLAGRTRVPIVQLRCNWPASDK